MDSDEFAFQICGETAIEALKDQKTKLQVMFDNYTGGLTEEYKEEVRIVIKEHALRIAHLETLISRTS